MGPNYGFEYCIYELSTTIFWNFLIGPTSTMLDPIKCLNILYYVGV